PRRRGARSAAAVAGSSCVTFPYVFRDQTAFVPGRAGCESRGGGRLRPAGPFREYHHAPPHHPALYRCVVFAGNATAAAASRRGSGPPGARVAAPPAAGCETRGDAAPPHAPVRDDRIAALA